MTHYLQARPGSRLLAGTLHASLLAATAVVSIAQADEIKIGQIQGAGHISPLAGEQVETTGVVTGVDFRGFYLQDASGDDNDATSDGIFVSLPTAPAIAVRDEVSVNGEVEEDIAGGATTGNLSTTRISSDNDNINVLSAGNALPEPVAIGRRGRIPPNVVVISADEIDPPINLQNGADAAANPFDPGADAIDFYESLEGMRVKVRRPVAISAVRTFNRFSSEFFTLADRGRDVAPRDARTARGGINLRSGADNRGDQNPERVQIQIDSDLFPGTVPIIKVGDRLSDVTGVLGYSFGNFEVNATELFVTKRSRIKKERTRLRPRRSLVTVASYNVLNLSPRPEDDNQRASLAAQIVQNLRSPDVVALQEIQDNDGEQDSGVTDATATLQALVDAIQVAGGPAYFFFDVAPADGASGGVPGGNIRNAFLYNPQRVELDSFVSLTPEELATAGADNPHAFVGTRDPLGATFTFNGRVFTVINNHLTSRFGSTPIFGAVQPFVQAGETEREAQTQALNDYVDSILADNSNARLIVTGDFNTFEFTNDVREILTGATAATNGNKSRRSRSHRGVLTNLIESLRDDNVYTFNFEGNSQVLDQLLVSNSLLYYAALDIVHVNVDFARVDDSVASDHEPLVSRFYLFDDRDH